MLPTTDATVTMAEFAKKRQNGMPATPSKPDR